MRISETGVLIVDEAVAALIKAHPGTMVHCQIREQTDEVIRHIADIQSLDVDIVLKGFDAPNKVSTLPDQLDTLRGLC